MSSSSLQAGIVLSNRYLILYKIGSGTFTSIYSAFDLQTKTNVAIKVENVAPQIKKGSVIDKEAQVLKDLQGALHCPSFQEYHTNGTSSASTNTLCFIAFELIAGEDMHSLRTRSATANQENSKQKKSRFLPINISSALHLSLQMLDCVQSVHEKGYLHRDVKPSNFVRTGMNEDEREFKIIDFGLSKSFVQTLEPNSPPLSPQIPFKITPPNTTNPLAYSSQTLYLKPRKTSAQFRGTTMYASVNVQSELDHSRSDDIFGVVYSFIDLVNGDLPWRPYATGEGKDKETVKTMKEAGLSDPRNMMVDPLIRSLGNFNHWIWQISNYLTTLDFYSTPDYGSIKKWMINACHEQGNGLVGNTVWKGGEMKKAIDLVWECNDNRRQEALGIRLQEVRKMKSENKENPVRF
ncbi:hypothetical protein TrLO_g2456 [Triparma laevis f. longispina]|uniref:Casein kinase I n=1 Tax=Triparma laevis f. longispina TaxID=1714387 RepID=A0A9W7KW54_9STRA|nr:hypothetical protein TrLO_g2456 [Triparma laevis f. longispina]